MTGSQFAQCGWHAIYYNGTLYGWTYVLAWMLESGARVGEDREYANWMWGLL